MSNVELKTQLILAQDKINHVSKENAELNLTINALRSEIDNQNRRTGEENKENQLWSQKYAELQKELE